MRSDLASEMQNPAFREQFEAEEREDSQMILDPFIEKIVLVFRKPKNEKEYRWLQELLDAMVDEVRDDESHPLTFLMEIVGNNLEKYDNENKLAIE